MNVVMLDQEGANALGLVCGQIVGDDVNFCAGGWFTTRSVRKATNSADVCRSAVLPSTSPVLVLNAA